MATVLDIISTALRICRVLGAGRTPKAGDGAFGLEKLQAMVNHLEGYGCSHPWVNAYESAARTVDRDEPSLRIHAKTEDGAFTITLPEEPRDGARFAVIDADGAFDDNALTIDSNGVLFDATLTVDGEPTGGSRTTTVLSTQGLRRTWMYRADLGCWVRTSNLELSAAFPFPPEFDQSFAHMLAVLLAPEYGADLDGVILRHADHGYARLAARYVEPLPVQIDGALLGARYRRTFNVLN